MNVIFIHLKLLFFLITKLFFKKAKESIVNKVKIGKKSQKMGVLINSNYISNESKKVL